MSPHARLLTLAVRNEADDQGVFEWKPVTLKMRLMPNDNVDVAALLGEMEANNQVLRFEHAGRHYGAIRNFRRYQRPKKPNSVHFLPEELRTYVGLKGDGSESTEVDDEEVPHQFGTDGEEPPQREEVGDNGSEEIDLSPNSRAAGTSPRQQRMVEEQRALDAEFERWWLAYPLRVAKGKARKLYLKIRAKLDADTLEAAARRYAAAVAGKDPEFIAHPTTWLNGERWLDEPPAPKPPNASAPGIAANPLEYEGSDRALAEMWNAGKRTHPKLNSPDVIRRLETKGLIARPTDHRRTA